MRNETRSLLTPPTISLLTTANLSPVGSLPMAKQNKITCITGSAKMNSITPTFLHILKRFFCNNALILPREVNCTEKRD